MSNGIPSFLGPAVNAQSFSTTTTTTVTTTTTTTMNSVVQGALTPANRGVVGNFFKGFETGFGEGFLDGFKDGLQGALKSPSCPCHPPAVEDSSHPQGSLSKDANGVITTPGGYKIEATAQYEWKVTGPDGKETRIWGDPHVDLGNDGGKGGNANDFEFKRPTTFVLGDGTRLNVSVKPYNNMTVTSGLEVLSGNDRATISDIDQGKGKVSDITHDGFAHVNDFGKNDVLVMGKDVTQWSFNGKEVTGSENGGESFKLGKDIQPLVDVPKQNGGAEKWAAQLLKAVVDLLKLSMPQTQQTSPFPGSNPYSNCWGTGQPYNQNDHLQGMGNAFKAIGEMFKVMGQLLDLTQQLKHNPIYTAF